MTRFEIIVEINGVKKYLDTDGIETISLNFNIADITEPDKRNSSYSKTIKVPETKNNRAIFSDISDLTIDSQFNPNKKSRCWILVDTIVVFEGNLQLKKISMDWRYDFSFYECVIYADNDGFFKELGELFLTDLDFSELNHNWTADNIKASWTYEWNKGYFYPLIDYGYDFNLSDLTTPLIIGTGNGVSPNPGVRVKQMYPSTNVKYIVDKIFKESGYQYTSTFLNTKEFKNLYVPYNRDGVYLRDINSLSGRFAIGLNFQIFEGETSRNIIAPIQPIAGLFPFFWTYAQNDDQIYREPFNGGWRIPFNLETSPYGDPDGVYNNTLYEYIAPANPAEQRFSINFDIEFIIRTYLDPQGDGSISQSFETQPGVFEYTGIEIKRSFDQNGFTIPGGAPVYVNGSTARVALLHYQIPNIEWLNVDSIKCPQDGQAFDFPFTFNRISLPGRVKGTITTDLFGEGQLNYPLRQGERIWAEFVYVNKGIFFRYNVFRHEYPNVQEQDITPYDLAFIDDVTQFSGLPAYVVNRTSTYFASLYPNPNPPPLSLNAYWGIRIMNDDIYLAQFRKSIFFNNLSPNLTEGELIPYNQNIPINVKQKDFISSLAKMFNLYIEPDKNNPKNLIIEPRDIYYETGDIKDWTSKLDTSSDVNEQILAETQNKEILLKYKDDKDFYNEDYRSKKNGMTYGEYLIEIDNDFTKGRRIIEPMFSPTPLIPMNETSVIIIPKIGKLNNGVFSRTDHNIRILTRYVRKGDQKIWNFDRMFFGTNANSYGYLSLTTQGISNSPHTFIIGDLIQITHNGVGGVYPNIQNYIGVVIDTPSSFELSIDYQIYSPIVGTISGTIKSVDGLQPVRHRGAYWRFDTEEIGYVPYLGHLDDPISSRYDLNFGQSTTYFAYQTYTNNNLYTLYWKNFLEEITSKDSRIITAQFYLTAADIADFRFSDKIYLKNQYFKVNKISNYDPTKEKLTTVELIKSGVENVVISRIENTGIDTNPIEVPGEVLDVVLRTEPFNIALSNPSNDIKKANSIVSGMNNDIYSSTSIVIGDNNRISGVNNFIFGNRNEIENGANGNLIFGNGNEIGAGIGGSTIFGSDTKVINSNTIQFNTKVITTSNFISAGRDEVLSMYFDNKPNNYISASRDMVREFGSQDPINFITCGQDVV